MKGWIRNFNVVCLLTRWGLQQPTRPKLNTCVRCTLWQGWCPLTLWRKVTCFTLWQENQLRPTHRRGWETDTNCSSDQTFSHSDEWHHLSVLFQDTKIRIHGSRKKGVVIQSDIVASNGMIHIINKLMDSVSPTVESDTQVKPHTDLIWTFCFIDRFVGSFHEHLVCFLTGERDEDSFWLWKIWQVQVFITGM